MAGMTNTTDDTESPIIRRVRALLAKAERTDNPHEAEAFSAKAFAMMDEHRLDEATVRGSAPGSIVRHQYELARKAKYLRPSLGLLGAVAKHYGVIVMVPSTGNSKRPSLVGDPDDIAAVILMFESLMIQRDRAILAVPVPPYTNTNSYRSSMAYGFASKIGNRLTTLRATVASTGTGTALELLDRGARVLEHLGNPTPRNTNAASVDPHGVREGVNAAMGADLGQDRIGNVGPRALDTAR